MCSLGKVSMYLLLSDVSCIWYCRGIEARCRIGGVPCWPKSGMAPVLLGVSVLCS